MSNTTCRNFSINPDKEYPEFTPNLSAKDIFDLGSFGGTYWREIDSAITGKRHKNNHKRHSYLKNIDNNKMTKKYNDYDKDINRFKVKVGSTLEEWEEKGWITKYDPYGWVQWYCNFTDGRRIKKEDQRQINRWIRIASYDKGRFSIRLKNMNKKNKDSNAIRQTLQHWGVDFDKYS